MSNYYVTIDSNCSPDTSLPDLFPGDTVTFASSGEHVVFCVDSADLFGESSYSIPPNGELTLTVEDDAPNVFYRFHFACDDPEALCPDWENEGSEGSGGAKVGP